MKKVQRTLRSVTFFTVIRLTTAELYAPMVLDHSDNILKKARKMSRTSEKFESA